jgi:hypothetical protein
MPSIFVWKAAAPNMSKSTIKIHSGSNWVLEENTDTSSSKSYIYLEQNVISESDDLLITFQTKSMPRDWVGSDLLEVGSVPYSIVKSDSYGVLEHIGEWMRFTPHKDDFEYNTIRQIMKG